MAPGFKVTPAVQLVSILGKGGMGDVWLADHTGLGARVVVKFLSTELATDEAALSRFKREAMASAAVKSPHVVQVFDHGLTPENHPFIVMEYLEGKDLSKHLLLGPLTLAEVAEIVGQVARALSRSHQAGIVHRDIKPENIFLCETGDGELFVKVVDFGIAKASVLVGRQTATGEVVGTPYYMSPEQIVGEAVDIKVDMWALAAVAYEALTGQVAFPGDTIGAITLAIHGPPPVPSRVNPEVTPEVDAWFAKAFARSAAMRFTSAKEMATAFREAAHRVSELPSRLAFRERMPSLDFSAAVAADVASPLTGRAPKGELSSTHLSSSVAVSAVEGPRARAPRVLIPALALAVIVLGLGAWRAVAGRTEPAHALATSERLPATPSSAPSAQLVPLVDPPPVTPSASAAPVAPPATSASTPPRKANARPHVRKPGKYDDIQ